MRIAILLGLAPLALLAACQSEAQKLESLRGEALAKCNGDANIKASMPGVDIGRFCTCLTNKLFEGRTAADLAKLDNDAEAQRVGMEGTMQCMAEQGAVPGGPAAVPAQAQEGAAETVEEVGDDAN